MYSRYLWVHLQFYIKKWIKGDTSSQKYVKQMDHNSEISIYYVLTNVFKRKFVFLLFLITEIKSEVFSQSLYLNNFWWLCVFPHEAAVLQMNSCWSSTRATIVWKTTLEIRWLDFLRHANKHWRFSFPGPCSEPEFQAGNFLWMSLIYGAEIEAWWWNQTLWRRRWASVTQQMTQRCPRMIFLLQF